MASIWRQFKGEPPKKLQGHIGQAKVATSLLVDYARRWAAEAAGTKAKKCPQNGMEYLLYGADGELRGSVWIEPISPPTKPDPGDSRVTKEPA
ncbi:hypothetical protein UFOVP1040_25 [uncultured Caudovirales phage]|uniref:Uncharacterized protein n=1 Tax=uncultured Caudovirales phage TaxID=2100421 RepID=A0A6J5Q5V6_9CAUD|nr:hypothetical protein UFOVP1040_25 [uncultured Caudovirales phage]